MRARRASLLGAAALLSGPIVGTVTAYLAPGFACRCADYVIRALDAAWERHAEHF